MQYDLIDEKSTVDNVLKSDAQNYLSRAVLLEYEARRLETLHADNPAMADAINDAWVAAEDAQDEADAFVKAAKLSDEEAGRIKRDTMRDQITNLEAQHVQAVRRRNVRRSAGIAQADTDDTIRDLERCKELALTILKEHGSTIEDVKADVEEANAPNREAKRAVRRQAQKAATAKKASGSTKKSS